MNKAKKTVLITGTSRGIGKYLAEYYAGLNYLVIGCSRSNIDNYSKNYTHFNIDISDEKMVKNMFKIIRKNYGGLDVLINNAGIASMNHSFLTSLKTVEKILNTNVVGTFLFCREAGKLMRNNTNGRIINFTTVATPLKLDGEAIYAASKAAVISLTQILAKEFAEMGITVNAIGPTPIKTDLIKSVPKAKIEELIERQAIKRYGKYEDISNIIDFFIKKESNYVTGQTLYLGGI